MKSQKSYYLDEEVDKKIREEAKKENRSDSDFLNLLLIKIFKIKK